MLKSLGVFKDFSDGSLKSVFEYQDKKIIEMSLLMNKDNMDVLCVPTHHFCSLGCIMCHLTNKGLNKQMLKITSEIFIEALKKSLTNNGQRITTKENLLISFMGVGEPLLNISLITDIFKRQEELKKSLGYQEISFAIATMFPSKEAFLTLEQVVLENHIPLKVHFSLHNPIDYKRKELIPSTNINVQEALNLLQEYNNKTKKDQLIMQNYQKFHRTTDTVEIHYTLMKDINDLDEELNTLISYEQKYKIAIKFIKFNPKNDLNISQREEYWIKHLQESIPDLRIKKYAPPGKEIGSSCGEFTKHYYHEEIETEEQLNEFLAWQKKHRVKKEDYI